MWEVLNTPYNEFAAKKASEALYLGPEAKIRYVLAYIDINMDTYACPCWKGSSSYRHIVSLHSQVKEKGNKETGL